MRAHIFVIFSMFWLAGCATSPQEFFPTYQTEVIRSTPVALLIDATLVEDIDGDSGGVNSAKQQEFITEIQQKIRPLLHSKGMNLVKETADSALTVPKAVPLSYCDEEGEAGEPVKAPVLGAAVDYSDDESREWLRQLLQQARRPESSAHNHHSGRSFPHEDDEEQVPVWHPGPLPPPEALRQRLGEVELLLVVGTSVYEVSTMKSLGSGLLTAIATGGMVAVMPGPGGAAAIALVRLRDGEILWADSVPHYRLRPSIWGMSRDIEELVSFMPELKAEAR